MDREEGNHEGALVLIRQIVRTPGDLHLSAVAEPTPDPHVGTNECGPLEHVSQTKVAVLEQCREVQVGSRLKPDSVVLDIEANAV